MADTGYNWGPWTLATYSTGTDVSSIDVNDAASLITDAISFDGLAAVEFALKWVEGNDGACDGNVNVYLSREFGDGTTYQSITDPPDYLGDIVPVQNTTKYKNFTVHPANTGSGKILAYNDSGQDGDLTIYHRNATIPAAS